MSNNTTYYWQVRAWNGSAAATYANSNAWWNFTVGSGAQATNDFLPIVMRSAPPSSIVNGDFEQGPGVGWQEYSTNNYNMIFIIDFPHGGSWVARLGDVNNEYAELYQQVSIPSSNPLLTFWYLIGSLDYCGYDFARVTVGGTTLLVNNLCQPNATGGWVQQNLDLSTFSGQNLVLKFSIETDSTLTSNFYIDDVSFGGSGALSEVPAVPPGQEVWLKPEH